MNKVVVGVAYAALSISLAFSLGGCGRKQDAKQGNVQLHIPGMAGTVGNRLPSNLPPYVEIYPGSEVIAAISGLGPEQQMAGTISLKTADPVEKVVAFYKQSIAKSGITVKGEFANSDVQSINAEDGKRAYSIIVSKANDGSNIQVTYK